MSKRSSYVQRLLSGFAMLAGVVLSVSGLSSSASAQRLAVYLANQMIAHPEFTYPVIVQLQDGAGNPVHASTKVTVTLGSSAPGSVRIYNDPHLTLNPPSGDFKGDTWAMGYVVAARVDATGGATITATAPGFASGSAAVTQLIGLPHGNQKWAPAAQVSVLLLPPVVVAGEKGPMAVLQPRDAGGRLTGDDSRTGTGYADFRLESSNRAVQPSSAKRTLSHWMYGGHTYVDTTHVAAAGQTMLTLHLFDRPAIAGGSAQLKVVPAAATVNPGNTIVTPPPPPQPPRPPKPPTPPTTVVPSEIVLQPGQVWEGDVPVSRILDLQARLQYARPAGSNPALDVSVNGHRISSPLLNKGAQYTYKDGRTFPYYDATAPGWMIFYSADFSANNGEAGGGYRVMTNPGEAYHYRWDVSGISGSGPTMRVRIVCTGLKSAGPLVVRITK